MARNKRREPVKQPNEAIEPAKVTYQRAEFYQGIIPHPEIIQRFEQIYPGAAEIIFTTFESQAAHRMELEKKVIDRDTKDSRLGLIFGFTIGLAGIGGGVACILSGHPIAGTVFGGMSLSSLVGVFVYGSRLKRTDLEAKAKEMQQLHSGGG